METTAPISHNNPQKKRKPGIFRKILGGEFLLSRQMRPWYPYFALIFILAALLVISEQRILNKRKQIADLENVYKEEITRLKATNQFIPYEENQKLIREMKARGFILDEEHVYIIKVQQPAQTHKHPFFKKNARHKSR